MHRTSVRITRQWLYALTILASVTTAAVSQNLGSTGQAWLGVQVQNVDQANHGVFVTGVVANGPAAVAGLPVGSVILRLNGQAVLNYVTFVQRMRLLAPGMIVELSVLHNQQPRIVRVRLGNQAHQANVFPQTPLQPPAPVQQQTAQQQTSEAEATKRVTEEEVQRKTAVAGAAKRAADEEVQAQSSTLDQHAFYAKFNSFGPRYNFIRNDTKLTSVQRDIELQAIRAEITEFDNFTLVTNWECTVANVMSTNTDNSWSMVARINPTVGHAFKWKIDCTYTPYDKHIVLAFESDFKQLMTLRPGDVIHFDGRRIFNKPGYGEPTECQLFNGLASQATANSPTPTVCFDVKELR